MSYLDEDFDPKSLKVADLKSILSEHDILFASNAKKSELMELFDTQITKKKKSKKLKDAAGRVKKDLKKKKKKTDADAEAVKSPKSPKSPTPDVKSPKSPKSPRGSRSAAKTAEESEPESKPKRSRKRKSEPAKRDTDKKPRVGSLFDEEEDDVKFHKELVESFSPKKSIKSPKEKKTPKKDGLEEETPKKQASRKQTPKKDPISPKQAETPSVKSTPKHTKTPSAKSTPKDTKTTPIDTKDSADSTQTSVKSTPKLKTTPSKSPSTPRTKSTPRKGSNKSPASLEPSTRALTKTLLTAEDEAKAFDEHLQKKTDTEKHEEKLETVRLAPGPVLTPRPRKMDVIAEPEESEAEESEAEESDSEDDSDSEIKNPARGVSLVWYILVWVVLSVFGLFSFWYREQAFAIGYCGHSIDEPTFYNPEYPITNKISLYLDLYKPKCVGCPAHARCFENLEIACYEDFIEYKPWYFDLVPFVDPSAKKCIPDTKKAEKLEAMIDFSLDLLRSKNALINCGRGNDNAESGLTQQELYELLLSMKAPYITNEEFDELWERSVVEIEKEPEIITESSDNHVQPGDDGNHKGHAQEAQNQVFRSTSLQNLDLKCQLQNTLIITLYNNKEFIIGVMVLLVFLIIVKLQYDDLVAQKKRVNSVYDEIIQKLKAQKSQPISYIGANQLRDMMLVETNLKYKLKLWKQVSQKVEKNSNVNYRLIENHGEIIKVWEWIGVLE